MSRTNAQRSPGIFVKKEDDQLNAFIANKQSGNRIIALLPVNCLSGISAQNNHSPSQHLTKVDIYTARLKLAYNIPAFSYIAQQRQRLYVHLTSKRNHVFAKSGQGRPAPPQPCHRQPQPGGVLLAGRPRAAQLLR